MEWVIRVIWDVNINMERKDLETLSSWAMENIDSASAEAIGNEEFFPRKDRLIEFSNDNSGFRIDMSKIVVRDDERAILILMDVARDILQNSGANMENVAMSYEPIL